MATAESRASVLPRLFQLGLVLVAVAAVGLALLRPWARAELGDDQTVKLFLVAIAALVANQVTRLRFAGLEIEKEVENLRRDVQAVETSVGGLEKSAGPGSKDATPPPTVPDPRATAALAEDIWSTDPNRGRFGGSPEANGRRLSATIEPIAGKRSAACRVKVRVESTDAAKPLRGRVVFHLHPTFGRWQTYDVGVRGGVAEDSFTSYGAFTVGAEADEGATRLELDLLTVAGGTDRFYEE
jgi:hypothetical protein